MFNKDYEPSKREKLPTLKQYLVSLPKNTKQLSQLFQVEIIWLPGTIPNFTLQTHKFRLAITEKHPLYADLQTNFALPENYESFTAFGIRITDRDEQTFQLEPLNKTGSWKALGSNGRKWEGI